MEDGPKFIRLPRGCLEDAENLLRHFGIKPAIDDQRYLGTPVSVSFHGELRPEQQMAASAMLAHDTGILAATTAFGKTVVAAWLIARRGANALVLVHRKQLMAQWADRLCEFLDITEREIGRLGGGRRKLEGRIDIATIQSLIRHGEVDDRIADYGHVIMDECHHVPAPGFAQVANRAKARYVTGLSATVTRKDGQHPALFMQCGPIRHRVDARRQAARRPFSHQVLVRPTGFRMPGEPDRDPRIEYRRICEHLTRDDARNAAICSDVGRSVRAGRAPLVLTERIDHLEALAGGLRAIGAGVVVLKGGMGTKLLKFRRLQSLHETRDRFRVNERLPIPFSEDGRMEVDFLDPASKLVLELDGSQHLGDREAYRRDRRKDALLQEHGYLVLRFLAEDLGTRLDAVLDEVLRALAARTGGRMIGRGS